MPMRVLVALTVIVILSEVLLGLAFWAGYYLVGGWAGGVIFSGGLVLLVLLPWVGTLEANYDTEGHRLDMRLSWWGRLMVQRAPEPEVRAWALGIPWRKKLEAKGPPEEAEAEHAEQEASADHHRGWRQQLGGMDLQDMTRLVPAALQALTDLLWEARELEVKVQAPTGNDLADTAIAAVVGHRGLGPLDLKCTGTGDRRVHTHFRIGMLRAGLALLYLAIQARPLQLAMKARAAHKEQDHSEQVLAEAEAKEAE